MSNPELAIALAKMGDPTKALLAGGAGLGLMGGVLENKDLPSIAKGILQGGAAGAVGGGALGYALSHASPFIDDILKNMGKGNLLSSLLVKAPLGVSSNIMKTLKPALGGNAGVALLVAGLLGGLGAALKGSAVPKLEQQGSLLHDVLIQNSKISSDRSAEMMGVNGIREMFFAKYANILQQNSYSNMGEAMQQAPHRTEISSNTGNLGSDENSMDSADLPLARGHLRAVAKKQEADQELSRRKALGMQIGSPLGGFAGEQLGSLASRLAGERSAEGLKGFFGYKERVLDPEKAKEIGRLLGNIGGGAVGGQLAASLHRNPVADKYMDQLGL